MGSTRSVYTLYSFEKQENMEKHKCMEVPEEVENAIKPAPNCSVEERRAWF